MSTAASTRPWCLCDARKDLWELYSLANAAGALEYKTVNFWKQFLTALKDNSPYAMIIHDQVPPTDDPDAADQLRRVDVSIEYVDQTGPKRFIRFIGFFLEPKRASNGKSLYAESENQCYTACESYALNPTTRGDTVYALAAVGTRWRWYVWRSNQLVAFDGGPEPDPRRFKDAADPEASVEFMKFYGAMVQNLPVEGQLARKSYLAPNFPSQALAPGLLGSNGPNQSISGPSQIALSTTAQAPSITSSRQSVPDPSQTNPQMIVQSSSSAANPGTISVHNGYYFRDMPGGRKLMYCEYNGFELDIAQPDLGAVVERAKEAMGLSDDKVFSTDILRIEVCSPDQPHLTMVDLPGLFRAGNKDQSVADAATVRRLVEEYMRRPRSIILAVVSAKSDFALQDITEVARKLDPEGLRTLGLITKPDTLSVGSESESSYLRLAQNRDVVLNLGWHVVKNRSFRRRTSRH
ncbi:hypothetical protein LTR86_010422 [Recurvomyces mirabilis]|nr:hypothetical protein LTR86_010422 [Recurvomyces mirabilis]